MGSRYDGRTIYHSRFDEPGIWSMPASGGRESVVVTGKPQLSYWRHWAVTESGLYLLDADAEPCPTIEFLQLRHSPHYASPVTLKTTAPGSPA